MTKSKTLWYVEKEAQDRLETRREMFDAQAEALRLAEAKGGLADEALSDSAALVTTIDGTYCEWCYEVGRTAAKINHEASCVKGRYDALTPRQEEQTCV